jgi:cell division protein FtsW (lipid II flippase)
MLFPICGAAVGFVSEGRTVLESALGSVVGQCLGFGFMRFMNGVDIHWIEFGVGLVVAFGITAAGAYVGEAIQEKRERAALEESELMEQGGDTF